MFLDDLDGDTKLLLLAVRGVKVDDPKSFITNLRKEVPASFLQAIDARFVAGREHTKLIVQQSWTASKRRVLIVKFDLDILLRLACDSRIENALETVGLRSGTMDVVFIAVGHQDTLNRLSIHLATLGKVSDSLLRLTSSKEKFLKKHHNISDLNLRSTVLKGDALPYILADKAAIEMSSKR